MKVVKNDLFDYPNRYIYQVKDGFKFSIDSLLLAEYTNTFQCKNILDMCTGNAPIPLVLSLKTNALITGFEIQRDISLLAQKSVSINKLDENIHIINDDIKNIDKYFPNEYFDVITCNPPYFKYNDNNYTNKNDYLTIARHEVTITLEDIFRIASKYIKNKGKFYLVHRTNRLDDIICLARKFNINVKEVQLIATKEGQAPRIVLVKCVKNSQTGIIFKNIICVDKLNTYQHLFEKR